MTTHPYGVRDVEKLLRLPKSTIRALVEAGFVRPTRGPRRAWLFSFQDLIMLRSAQALVSARISRRRILGCLKALRRRLPGRMPLSGLRIGAIGGRIVVTEGARRWQADSGQYLLALEVDRAGGDLAVVHSPRARLSRGRDAERWFEEALDLEAQDPEAAIRTYQRIVRMNPGMLEAHVNLGCLLHEAGDFKAAERAYRHGLLACGQDAGLLYNLAVLLEDAGRREDAREAYEQAVAADPGHAEGHYNLALLCEALGRPRQALRHMSQYRRLTRRK